MLSILRATPGPMLRLSAPWRNRARLRRGSEGPTADLAGWATLPCQTSPVRALLVSDLHYDLRKLDWVVEQASDVDLLAIAGDLLSIASAVPLDAQIAVVLEYLARCAGRTDTVVCSGNHDLDHRTEVGEKAAAWMTEARSTGVAVDGDSRRVGDWLVTACAWWEGDHTLARLEESLAAAARDRTGRWLWVYHGPPEGPLSWTGRSHHGDPELPRLLDHHRPDIVLCGHIHEAPFVDGGGWCERRGDTWLFNSGYQGGPVPTHTFVDLERRRASWWSFQHDAEVALDDVAPVTAQ
jgi:Icc-related predicted phosphoesterase